MGSETKIVEKTIPVGQPGDEAEMLNLLAAYGLLDAAAARDILIQRGRNEGLAELLARTEAIPPRQLVEFLRPKQPGRSEQSFLPGALREQRAQYALAASGRRRILNLQVAEEDDSSAEMRGQIQLIRNLAEEILSARANFLCPPNFSSHRVISLLPRIKIISVLSLLLIVACLFPAISVPGFCIAVLFVLAANSMLKLLGLISGLPDEEVAAETNDLAYPSLAPKVSLLIPVFKETSVLADLFSNLSKLRYPAAKLEFILLYEASDSPMREWLAEHDLPDRMTAVKVPKSIIQTKPRALNYGLNFCRGEIVGIYDAEDAPEPDQIRKAVEKLLSSGSEVACVQAVLDFYNPRQSWISRCFTIEYAAQFRIMLRGFDRLNLPIPLGGTSVFFRRDVLEQLGAWDAFNVTEDADLGYRLRRMGYRCLWLDSTTLEEANFRAWPWIRQRSRWLKGFVVTWLTHMRKPLQLIRDLGLGGAICLNIQMLGTFLSFFTAPFVWPFWLLSFGIDGGIFALIPKPILMPLIICYVSSEVLAFTLYWQATRISHLRHLRRTVLTMLLYWPLGSVAAFKALFELFLAPVYWDKTQHGLARNPDLAEAENSLKKRGVRDR